MSCPITREENLTYFLREGRRRLAWLHLPFVSGAWRWMKHKNRGVEIYGAHRSPGHSTHSQYPVLVELKIRRRSRLCRLDLPSCWLTVMTKASCSHQGGLQWDGLTGKALQKCPLGAHR